MSALDVAAALAAHQYREMRGDYEIAPFYKHFGCTCGWEQNIDGMSGWSSWVAAHRAHVADALRPVIAAAQAETYREIADRLDTWEFPAGSDVLDPMYRLVGSLRDRADRIGGAS